MILKCDISSCTIIFFTSWKNDHLIDELFVNTSEKSLNCEYITGQLTFIKLEALYFIFNIQETIMIDSKHPQF